METDIFSHHPFLSRTRATYLSTLAVRFHLLRSALMRVLLSTLPNFPPLGFLLISAKKQVVPLPFLLWDAPSFSFSPFSSTSLHPPLHSCTLLASSASPTARKPSSSRMLRISVFLAFLLVLSVSAAAVLVERNVTAPVTTRTARTPPRQPKWRGTPVPTQTAAPANEVTRAGVTGFLGTTLGMNTNAIASWFRTVC